MCNVGCLYGSAAPEATDLILAAQRSSPLTLPSLSAVKLAAGDAPGPFNGTAGFAYAFQVQLGEDASSSG